MTRKAILLFFILIAISQILLAQKAGPAWLANDKADNMRSDARKLFNLEHPTSSDLQKGIFILNNTITYLDSLPIQELAQGNIYLKARKHDVYFDLITANLIVKNNEGALTAFEKMCDEGGYYFIDLFETDSLYTPIRSDVRFKNVIRKLKSRRALWQDEALKSPFSPNLSTAEKTAGLSLLWSQAKYNFANFDHAGINWDSTYLAYLNKIANTQTTLEYYKVLQSFYAQLKDGHSNVYFPKELADQVNARPPIRTELIEGRVLITEVFSKRLLQSGIVPGLEIVAIDSLPILDYAKRNLAPYLSSSTLQDLHVREYSYALLSGAKDTPIDLELKSDKGKVWHRIIPRTGYTDVAPTLSLSFKTIKKIGYLVINNFEDHDIIKQFDSLYNQIAATKGLIIDLRDNGGGNSYIGYHILSALTSKNFQASSYKIPRYVSAGKYVAWEEHNHNEITPDGKTLYDKPAILLVSARTFSAAEDFTVAFKYMKRGRIVGQPTGGSTGQPIDFILPGGGAARVCGRHDLFPDGKEFIGIGINPDILIVKKAVDVKKNKDAVLTATLNLLN